jgi:hypothetical protein
MPDASRLDALKDQLEGAGFPDADRIVAELFVNVDTEGRPCQCSCHPSVGSSGGHEPGACTCRQSPEERREETDRLFAQLDRERERWENSEEGRATLARKAAERAELEAWIASDDSVEVTSWGGMWPEQWWGRVDGHSFYFREKRGLWRIELDLRPSGRFYQRIVRPDDPDAPLDFDRTEDVEIEEGDVIAQGSDADLGVTPLHHGRFIINTIRAHLRRGCCAHPGARRYCPECGAEMS